MTMDPEELATTVAMHEAGHAVMRWVLGMSPSEVWVTAVDGYCDGGEGEAILAEDALMFALAGFAVEAEYFPDSVDFENSITDDFEEAKGLLRRCEWLRMTVDRETLDSEKPRVLILSIDDALKRHFGYACERLQPYSDHVCHLASELLAKGKLSGEEVKALLDAFESEQPE